jgi:hypothetical protein
MYPSRVRICIVVASIGREELFQTLAKMLKETKKRKIIVSLYKPSPELTQRLDEFGVTTVIHNLPGASNGRNVGILKSFESADDFLGYVFPNDRTEFVSGSLDIAENFLRNTTNVVGVGKWVNEFGETMLSPKAIYSRDTDFLTSYEPSLIIPKSLISRGLRFDPNFGTGSEGKWQSAEAAKILLDAKKMGGTVLPVVNFINVNKGSTIALPLNERISKGYKYGSGSGRYFQTVSSFPSRITQGTMFSLAPTAWYVYGKFYWRNAGFFFSISSTVGRFRGLLSKRMPK